MRKINLFPFLLFLLIIMPLTSAEDITFSINQTEYYFLTGQEAVIPLTINNTFEKDIAGQIQYSIIQTANQGGQSYSSTRSNVQSFTVQKGNNTLGLNFGSSNTPVTYTVSMEFSYHEQDDDYIVSLDDIKIFFVSNESQQNNQENPQQSNSEKIIDAPQQNNQEQQQPQTPQEQLQNNQMNQDSQALKEQMQQQMQQQQAEKKEFEQSVKENTEVQEMQEELQNQGYNITDEQFNNENNNTGDFNFSYQNDEEETANIEGRMENGEITELQKQTAEDRQQMMDILNQSQQFQDFQEQLNSEGFNQTNISFNQNGNDTTVEIEYKNEKNETAMIQAEFEDEELKEVRLEKQEDLPWYILFLAILIPISIISLYLYRKYILKKQVDTSKQKPIISKPFDYRNEAYRLLNDAKKDYKQGLYKDAYGKAGQSLRLFLSYYHGVKDEMTNVEMIRYLKKLKKPHDHIKQCLDLCSLVEFAKYAENESDFSKIIQVTSEVISQ